jgi:hypothetical protein
MRMTRRRRAGALVWACFFIAWSGVSPVDSAEPGRATATLNVLAGDVKVQLPDDGSAKPAANGMTIVTGTRVQTGKKSTALVTFLDGSTLTVQPESDVTVKQADVTQKRSRVTIGINVGTVWARVVKLVDPESTFSLQSNTATATVHDGLIGARQDADGGFTCWTRAGDLWLIDPSGRARSVLKPGQMDIVKGSQRPDPHPFFSNHSALRITAPSSILPLIVMPDQARVAGFLAPETEVNHVFGSYTGSEADGRRVVEVPAGLQGPFTVILKGEADGPFQITVTSLYKGAPLREQQLSGTIKRGDRLAAQVTQQLEGGADDPKTAKVSNVTLTALEPTTAPLPGAIPLLPLEPAGAK